VGGGEAVSQLEGARTPTDRTPQSPTLITAGVEDYEVLPDIFIGGRFKGTLCDIERHYGSAAGAETPSVTDAYVTHHLVSVL